MFKQWRMLSVMRWGLGLCVVLVLGVSISEGGNKEKNNRSVVEEASSRGDVYIFPKKRKQLPQHQQQSKQHENNATEAYRSCYFNTGTTRFAPTPGHFAINETMGVLYYEVPKAASRFIRKSLGSRIFPGVLSDEDHVDLFKFTCYRDPINRFVSVFNFIRHTYPKLWCKDHNCEPEHRLADAYLWATRLLSQGYFEWHLWPQSLVLSNPDGSPHIIHHICDTSNISLAFQEVRKQFRNNSIDIIQDVAKKNLRSSFKVLKQSELPKRTIRTLCKAYHVDYCCFDIDFPPECEDMREKYCLGENLDGSRRYWSDGDGGGLPTPSHEPARPPW
mmetsp:Transcript_11749/g.21482  ORF Transcript_11749/g.21482 Transcript_11749/m.21482 type:complete len:332 (+) Transcript_11749:17-1012(+)